MQARPDYKTHEVTGYNCSEVELRDRFAYEHD